MTLYIIPTIDAEGMHGEPPFEKFFLGKLSSSSSPYGTPLLGSLFQEYGISASFFVDVYESAFFGDAPLRAACEDLLKQSQDIQLHTHPSWSFDARDSEELNKIKVSQSHFDPQRPWMHLYSEEEQVEILRKGLSLLSQWIGITPIAHRAGGYGANEATLRALARVGIPVDSSMFYHHKNCHLSLPANAISESSGVIEVPVTCYARTVQWNFGVTQIPRCGEISKTDLDWCSLDELLWFLDAAQEQGITIMNFFMHSYSLLSYSKRFRHVRPDQSDIKKLRAFLSVAKKRADVEFLSFSQFLDRYRTSPELFHGRDALPTFNKLQNPLSTSLKRLFRQVA